MKQGLKKQIQGYLENPGKEREAPMEELLEVWLAAGYAPAEERSLKNRLLREIRRRPLLEQKWKAGKLGRDWAMPELCRTPVGPAVLLLKYCCQSSTLWDTCREIGQMLSWGEVLRPDPRVEAELEYWLTWKPEEE